MRILLTGASGFIGRAVIAAVPPEASIRLVSRNPVAGHGAGPNYTADLSSPVDWSQLLQGVNAVIHLAARVHRLREDSPDPLAEYRQVNSVGTIRLGEAAAKNGVSRFVFVSTVKVHGEVTTEEPFHPDSPFRPADPYGRSKAEAEEGLRAVEQRTGLNVTVVRPPLVYGPGVRSNFLRLMSLVDRGVPLPFGRVDNRRSLVYVENLAQLLVRCAMVDSGRGQNFLVADGPSVSTPDLVRSIARSLGKPARLMSVPVGALRSAGRFFHVDGIDRLTSSLEVDISALREQLGWSPPIASEEGVARTVRWYRNRAALG